MDNWEKVWEWAKGVWGEDANYGFHRFFGGVASQVARNEGWDEVGSSDVWWTSFECVKRAMESGKVTTRKELVRTVLDNHCVSADEAGYYGEA